MTESPDRRIQRTQLALRDALLSLLVTKGWDEISIVDICDRANVGRSTFYIHFQCKEDLLQSGLDNLRVFLSRSEIEHSSPNNLPLPFLHDLIEHVLEHRDLSRCVIGKRSGHVVRSRFRNMIYGLVERAMVRDSTPIAWRRELFKNAMTGAVFDLLAWLPDSPNNLSAREVESEFRRTILAGALLLQEQAG
ncbi:MAG: TetR/AcrR family transcriptional regulator [Roseiarcus sp.]